MKGTESVFALLVRILGPNTMLVFMVIAVFGYYQASTGVEAPTWRNVAAGSMALAGTLAGLGYRDFINRMRKLERVIEDERKDLDQKFEKDREIRNGQHKANVGAIVALAMATSDTMKDDQREKVQEIVQKLLGDD